MSRYAKASSVRSSLATGRRASLAFLGALVLAIAGCLGAASAIADTAPSVTIGSPSAVAYTTAHVSGTVNPQGGPSATSWHFEYTTDPVAGSWEYAFSASGEISGAEAEGTSPIAVGGELEGLAPNTTYSVRLVAANGEGANQVATAAPYPTLTTKAVAPPSISIDPITTFTTTTAQLSGEINPGGTDPTFTTFWHFECLPECPTFLGSFIPADNASHAVTQEAVELQPNVEYEISLIAENAGGQASAGPVTVTTAASPPKATTIPAYALAGGTRALLGGRINATNQPTTYWFEYGLDDSYGTNVPAGKDASAGSGGQDIVQTQELTGLAPEATYHYRVVAENATGVAEGLDREFTTAALPAGPEGSCANQALRVAQHAEPIPGCRALEMVSPVEKNNVDAGGTEFVISSALATPSGDAFAYFSNGAFAGSESSQTGTAYIANRGPDGWANRGILPPVEVTSALANRAVLSGFISPDLSKSVVMTTKQMTPDASTTPFGVGNLYIRDNTTGSYELVTTGEQTNASPSGPEPPTAVGVSSDFRHVIFTSPYALTPDAPTSIEFNLNLYEWEAGSPPALRLVGYLPDDSIEQAGVYPGGQSNHGASGSASNAISDDGSRVFFNAPASGGLYVREHGTSTKLITASGSFWTATPDGSQVLYLDNDGVERYDLDSKTVTNISPDNAPADGSAPKVEGLVGNSADLSVVYFIAEGQLVPGEGRVGARNLYVSDHGVVDFITVLGKSTDGDGNELALESGLAQDAGYPTSNQRAVAADGQQLAFASGGRLTAYDNRGHSEIYLFDNRTGQLLCPSCRQDAVPAIGDALLQPSTGGHVTFTTLDRPQFNFVAGGSQLYFETTDPVVGEDTNGANDVYLWEGGRPRLITPGIGDSPQGHLFMGATPSGHDVFVTTRNRMVAQDIDELNDVYDIRVDGGIASQNVASSVTSACEGQQCRTGSTAPPASSSPASREIQGAKNATPKRQKHKKKNKKHHGKKHHKKKHGKKKQRAGNRAQANG